MSSGAQVDWSKYEASPAAAAPQVDWSKYEPTASAPGAPPESWLDRIEHGIDTVNAFLPGITQIHQVASALHDTADQAMQPSAPMQSPAKTFGTGVVRDLSGAVAGATTPQGLALTGATIAAPEVMGPALMAHGLYKGVTGRGDIRNPDVLQNTLNSAAEVVGGGAAALGPGPLTAASNNLRASAAKAAVGPLVKQPLGMTQANIAHGIDPAAGINNEGFVAGSREGLVSKIQQRVSDLHQATDNVLQNQSNTTAPLDATPVIDDAIQSHVDAAEKVGNDALATRLQKVGDALKTKHGPIQGTPYDINLLKRSVGDSASDLGAFKSADPVEAGVASMMGDVYTGLKNMVNDAVPEVQPLNQRSANLLGAKTAVNRNIALDTNRSPFSGLSLSNALPRLAESTIGSTPVRTAAARLLNPESPLSVPTEGIYGTPQRFPAITGTQQELPSVNGPLFEMRQTPAPQRPGPLARIAGRDYSAADLGQQAPGGPSTAFAPIELPASEGAAPLARIYGKQYREATPALVTPPTTTESSVSLVEPARIAQRNPASGQFRRVYQGVPQGTPQYSAPDFAYRSRDVGETGVPTTGSRPQATTDLNEAQSYAEPGAGREQVTGKPQEVIRYDLSKLKEGVDYERVARPGKPDWIRMLRPLREGEVEAAD